MLNCTSIVRDVVQGIVERGIVTVVWSFRLIDIHAMMNNIMFVWRTECTDAKTALLV